jgi:hypothetical protein
MMISKYHQLKKLLVHRFLWNQAMQQLCVHGQDLFGGQDSPDGSLRKNIFFYLSVKQ